MSKLLKRWGGKLGGDHATVIEAAWRFLPEMIRESTITRITPGFINPASPTGRSSVKIVDADGCILLSVRGGTAHQEIRFFCSNSPKAKLAIARAARNAQFHISFGNKQSSNGKEKRCP